MTNVPLATLSALPRPGNFDDFYPALGRLECGLLDGGCLAFARAAHAVLGGEIWGVTNGAGRPDHYVLRVGPDLYLDGDGVSSGAALVQTLLHVEHAHGPLLLRAASRDDWTAVGEIDPGDDLQPALEAAVRRWLDQRLSRKPRQRRRRCYP